MNYKCNNLSNHRYSDVFSFDEYEEDEVSIGSTIENHLFQISSSNDHDFIVSHIKQLTNILLHANASEIYTIDMNLVSNLIEKLILNESQIILESITMLLLNFLALDKEISSFLWKSNIIHFIITNIYDHDSIYIKCLNNILSDCDKETKQSILSCFEPVLLSFSENIPYYSATLMYYSELSLSTTAINHCIHIIFHYLYYEDPKSLHYLLFSLKNLTSQSDFKPDPDFFPNISNIFTPKLIETHTNTEIACQIHQQVFSAFQNISDYNTDPIISAFNTAKPPETRAVIAFTLFTISSSSPHLSQTILASVPLSDLLSIYPTSPFILQAALSSLICTHSLAANTPIPPKILESMTQIQDPVLTPLINLAAGKNKPTTR